MLSFFFTTNKKIPFGQKLMQKKDFFSNLLVIKSRVSIHILKRKEIKINTLDQN
jgi:hypothetical protein